MVEIAPARWRSLLGQRMPWASVTHLDLHWRSITMELFRGHLSPCPCDAHRWARSQCCAGCRGSTQRHTVRCHDITRLMPPQPLRDPGSDLDLIIALYHNMPDHVGKYIARSFYVRGTRTQASMHAMVFDSQTDAERVLTLLFSDLLRTSRAPEDHPTLLATWTERATAPFPPHHQTCHGVVYNCRDTAEGKQGRPACGREKGCC